MKNWELLSLLNHFDLDSTIICRVYNGFTDTYYPIYKDTAMKEKEALFIYNNIPLNLCKEIKLWVK